MSQDDTPAENPSGETSSSETYHQSFDVREASPSHAVVTTVSAVIGEPPTELDPLYETVDPEALDTILTNPPNDRQRGDISVEFTYHGHEVRVSGTGTIQVQPLADTADEMRE